VQLPNIGERIVQHLCRVTLVDPVNIHDVISGHKGRPHRRPARMPNRIDAVRALAVSPRDRPGTHQTPAQIARTLGTRQMTVRRILDDECDLQHFRRMNVHAMTDAQKRRRVINCTNFLRNRDDDWHWIVYSDEKVGL
jgi:hypothetical protein